MRTNGAATLRQRIWGTRLVSAYAQCISHAIDVIKPRGDQRDLQDTAVIESDFPKSLMMVSGNACRIARQQGYEIEHHSILFRDLRCPVIILQRSDQFFIQGYATQKLCVRFDSIMTAVRN